MFFEQWALCQPTVEGGVHPANIDQQTDHCHRHGRVVIGSQLLLEYLARLTTLGHGVYIYVRKGMARGLVRVLGEDTLLVAKDELQEFVLDVLPP